MKTHAQGEKDLRWPAAGLHLGGGGGIHAILPCPHPPPPPFAKILPPLGIYQSRVAYQYLVTSSQALTCALVPTPHTSVQTAQFK